MLIQTRDQQLILGILTQRGIVSSMELQTITGKSQATVSRALAGLSGQVLTLGRARAARYALPKPIRGMAAQQPLWWTDRDGGVRPFGVLSFLAGDILSLASDFVPAQASLALPWFLSPLRAEGFLGRLHARHLAAAGLDGDPERWGLESVLFSALHLHDPGGAITLGDHRDLQPRPRLPVADDDLLAALDAYAADVASTLPAGSSAGGEQPKFLATLANGQDVLVKFTPPRGTPFGDRWRDLLHAECLASTVLAEHGVAVARTRVLESPKPPRRTYLLSERFDRIGARGRRHVVAIGEVHKAFVPDAYSHWAAAAAALARQGRLSTLDAQRVSAIRDFGLLIGNTDMHSGNLGLFVELEDLARGRFALAPVYDMLPMRWRPNATLGGAPDYAPFEIDPTRASSGAAGPARAFWSRLEAHAAVSKEVRAVAREMGARLTPFAIR